MAEKPSEALIAKIRKILSKTEDAGCTPEESANAFALASRLMAEFNLEMDDIKLKEGEAEVEWAEEIAAEGIARWNIQDNITWGICKKFFFVEGFFTWSYRTSKKPTKTLMFFGKKENVAAAKHVFSGLTEAYETLWTTYKIIHGRPGSERRMFVAGVAEGFKMKLEEERRAIEIERDLMKGTSGGTALALCSVEAETLAQYALVHPENAKRGYTKGTYASYKGSRSTLEAGIEAGRRLNLNKSLGGKGQKRIGG